MKRHYLFGIDIKYLPEPFSNYSVTDDGVLLKETNRGQVEEIDTSLNKMNGCHAVTLCSDRGHTAYKLLHRIVLEVFFGASDAQSRHKDGDKSNNHLSNLEYITCSDKAHKREVKS